MTKRLIIILFAILGIATAARAEFRWGPSAGANFSNLFFKQDLVGRTMSVGPQAGVMGEMMFPGIGIGVDFGLRWQMAGAKVNLGDKYVWACEGYGNEQLWEHTIQIPINIRFKYTRLNGIEEYVAPLVYAGPLFAIKAGHNGCGAMEYPAGYFGLQCGLGGEFFRHLQVSAGYMWGMSYCTRTEKLDNFSARIRGWQLNVVYLF